MECSCKEHLWQGVIENCEDPQVQEKPKNLEELSPKPKGHLEEPRSTFASASKSISSEIEEDPHHKESTASSASTSISQIERRRKNARALHIIQVSSGPENLSLINKATSARAAWNKLAFIFKPRVTANLDIEKGFPNPFLCVLQ